MESPFPILSASYGDDRRAFHVNLSRPNVYISVNVQKYTRHKASLNSHNLPVIIHQLTHIHNNIVI